MSRFRRRRSWPAAAILSVALATAACLLPACSSPTPLPAGVADGPGWSVAMHDPFDGSSLDTNLWGTCHWWAQRGCTIITNDEAEWYVPGQVAVGGGALRLTARPSVSRHLGTTFDYVSGMVSSGRPGDRPADKARFEFTYGFVQVRFRTPGGAGLWPAIWMLPVTNRSLPEIDLLEQYGHNTRRASMTLHSRVPGSNDSKVDRHTGPVPDLAAGWHTVGLDWSPGRLRWLIDGVEQYRVEGARVPSEPMYLVMNLAVGGRAGDPPASTRFPATFLIDDVTVWREG